MQDTKSGKQMKISIEVAVKKAMDQILEKRALEATQLRAERSDKFEYTEKMYRSILKINNDVEEDINAIIEFWQEQAYMQGLEDSQNIQNELRTYGIQ